MDYGLEKYEYENVSIDTDIGSMLVENGADSENFFRKSTYVGTEISDSKTEIHLLLCEKDKIETKVVKKDKLKAPVESGTAVGNIYYLLDGRIAAKRKIVTVSAVEETGVNRFLSGILELYCMNGNTQSVK